MLEIVNLLNIGIASHNVKASVPSNIPESNIFIPCENLKTQKHMDDIQKWTDRKQMLLNVKKTKNIVFNFSRNLQFSTDIQLGNETIETVSEAKLLGTTITNNLSWNKNTSILVRQGNIRMQFLHKASKFTNNIKDLKQIYISQIRSKLEQSAVVWHSSLTQRNENDLERVQKAALKVILRERYQNYGDALTTLRIKSLKDRREDLCLKFAKSCLKVEKFKKFFPLNKKDHVMSMRNSEKFALEKCGSVRYRDSALPYMKRLLNKYQSDKNKLFKAISVPMNYDASPNH